MKHQVKKQLFELTLSQRKDAYRVQQLVSEHYRTHIIQLLEKVFDELAPPDDILRIDKLEIDLGIIHEREIETRRWEDLLFKKLSEQLSLMMQNRESFPELTVLEKHESIADQWLHYMQHGYLPYNATKTDREWLLQVLTAFASDYRSITALRALIHGSDIATERIILQHNVSFLVALLEALCSTSQKSIPVLIEELTDILEWQNQLKEDKIEGGRKGISLQVWSRVLQVAARRSMPMDETNLIYHLIEYFSIGIAVHQHIPVKYFSKKRKTGLIFRQIINGIKRQNENEKRETGIGTPASKIAGIDITIPLNSPKSNPSAEKDIPFEKPSVFESGHLMNEGRVEREKEESIYVKNAGMVLIHPFLLRFFSNLSLIENEEFVTAESHQRALVLLHFLATGEMEVEEHALVTAKLLCGYPLHKPVQKQFDLTAEEKDECELLIKNIVGQWDILGNTSADGLRQGFLQREGKFSSDKGKQTLYIEPQAIDLLLDYIPWSISMVKLPWMNDILWIEWH
jgi:hypothetical protein